MDFLKRMLSESDGSPSAARVIMLLLSIVVCACVGRVFWYLTGMDATRLAIWLPALPWIIGALAGLIGAPYFINKGGNAVTEALQAFASTKKQ